MITARSSTVSAWAPMPASAIGAHVENSRGSQLSPLGTLIITCAVDLVWPASSSFRMPSSVFVRLSASSINNVGGRSAWASIRRNTDAQVARETRYGRATRRIRTSNPRVLPQRFVGERNRNFGEIHQASKAWVCMIQSAAATAAASLVIRNRCSCATTASNSAAPSSTGSGHGSTSAIVGLRPALSSPASFGRARFTASSSTLMRVSLRSFPSSLRTRSYSKAGSAASRSTAACQADNAS